MSAKQRTILLVDDEPDLLELLQYNLERAGYAVHTASNGIEAMDLVQQIPPDVIVLDIMMPQMDGLEVCRRIRRDPKLYLTPILMLTARTGEKSEIEGLDVGADDYLPKPVSPRRLLSRIRALLRRSQTDEEVDANVKVFDLEIDRDRYVVLQHGDELRLPRKQFELLFFLASNPGKVFSRQDLLDQVWGTNVYVVDRTVDVHIRKIRERLGSWYIETIKGVGYKFVRER